MSATPNNSGAWGAAASPQAAPPERAPSPAIETSREGSRNALQALLAFACIHEQAARRRRLNSSAAEPQPPEFSQEEEFALDEVLQLVADRAVSITGADGVAIALAHDNAIVCRASTGSIAPDPGARLDPKAGFSGACLRSGQTVRCDDSETDSRVNAQACRVLGTRSMVAVPLSAKQRVVGLIEAFSKESYGFNDSDVRSLNLLGELILAAIRPEEEDRLAELSRKIVVPELAPPAELPSTPDLPRGPARILVDEKFVPSAERFAPFEVSIPDVSLPGKAAPSTGATPSPEVTHSTEVTRSTEATQSTEATPSTEVTKPVAVPAPLVQAVPEAPREPIAAEPVPYKAVARDKRSVWTIVSTAAALVVIGFLGWALVWKGKHIEQAFSNTHPAPVVVTEPNGDTREIVPTSVTDAKPASPNPQVTGIRHWSTPTSSTVVVDLEDQVEYEAHSLENPPRMYFDLHDTRMAPGLANQSLAVTDDPFLRRVRMAQPVEGITRVVLETKRVAEFSFSLDSNPYRLIIEVHKPGAVAPPTSAPAPLEKPSPDLEITPKKNTKPNPPTLAPADMRIVLDAGHGGWDLGAVGRRGLIEKEFALDIVQRLGKLIENKLGAQVIYTRDDDSYVTLEKRAEIANVSRADLFLSVHANYSNLVTARGVETYYSNTYSSVKARTDEDNPALKQVDWTGVDIRAKVTDSHKFAADVQQSLYGGLLTMNPELRNRGVKEAQYVVLTGTQMPAVLAEVSFVSSPADEDKLQSPDYRQKIAEALYRGVARYRDDLKHTKLASARHD